MERDTYVEEDARFQPVRKQRVIDEIVRQIIARQTTEADREARRLPSERDLARQLGVSRASVREALAALQMRGVVESKHGEGAWIVGDRAIQSAVSALSDIVALRIYIAEDPLEVRCLIEPFAARKAAERASPEDVVQLRQAIADMEEAIAAGESGARQDTAFHQAIAQAAGNSILVRLITLMNELMRESRSASLRGEQNARISLAGHRRILAAIVAGDPAGAEQAMRAHLDDVAALVLETITAAGAREE